MLERLQNMDMSNTCTEETLLYQLISGLHTSINMHVAKNFYDAKLNQESPNHGMYVSSIGKHPDRLRNLYFLYAVTLRAINRAEPLLKSYDYITDLNPEEDRRTPEIMSELLKMTLNNCEEPFNEKNLFIRLDNDFE